MHDPVSGMIGRAKHAGRRGRKCWVPLSLLLAFLLCTLARTSLGGGDGTDLLAEAFQELGVEESRVRPDPFRALRSEDGSGPLPLASELLYRPLDGFYRTGLLRHQLVRWNHSAHRTLLTLASEWNAQVSRGYWSNPFEGTDRLLTESEDPVALACSLLERSADWEAGRIASEASSLYDLPPEWQLEVARLMMVGVLATSIEGVTTPRWAERWLDSVWEVEDQVGPEEVIRQLVLLERPGGRDLRWAAQQLDRAAIAGALLDATAAAEDFVDFARNAPEPPPVETTFSTPLGKVRVSTRDSDDTLSDGPYFLSIDLAGNDIYQGSITRGGSSNPVSIIIDLAGDDTYLQEGFSAGPGAGVLGVGVLYDAEGNDTYQGEMLVAGAAVLGGSVLVDDSGDDRYVSRRMSQGAAFAGIALLLDRSGDDHYTSLNRSQAFGGPLAVAALIDLDGDDAYELSREPNDFASPQLPEVNSSLGQGCGLGMREDSSDGKSLSGGIGLLLDASGDDTYSAGVMAQGMGYLGGAGLLFDDGGNDRYEATWYAQAASAHRAAGVLVDRSGDDIYLVDRIVAQGGAHDYGVSLFADLGGHDHYTAEDIAWGGANENSVAIFVDLAGDDRYHAGNPSGILFGAARTGHGGSLRESALGLGLFFDLGGTDTYPAGVRRVGEGRSWTWPRRFADHALDSELGWGIDAGSGPPPFHFGPITPPSVSDDRVLEQAIETRRLYRQR